MKKTLQLRTYDPLKVPQPRSQVEFPVLDRLPVLEIGCGVGLHPIQWASRNPDQSIIAIEHTKTRFSRFRGRLDHHRDADNIIPVFDDAVCWVTHRVPPQSLGGVYILYPNPYPKEAQGNKRWHRMPFMSFLLDTIVPGGFLQLATNEGYYADEAVEWFTNYWGLELAQRTNPSASEAGGGRTHFERKYLGRGETCHDILCRRT